MTLPLFVSPYLVELLESCRELMRTEPDEHPTLRDAWYALTEEDRVMTPDDHRWLAENDLGAAMHRKVTGRVRYQRPETDPKRLEKRTARFATPAIRRRLLLMHPWCAYCRGPATEVDHIWPYSGGGSNEITNLAPICRPCNASKKDMTVAEWAEFTERKGRQWPPTPDAAVQYVQKKKAKHAAKRPPMVRVEPLADLL